MAEKSPSKTVSRRVLLIQDRPHEKQRIRRLLEESGTDEFKVDFADRLSEGLRQLSTERYAAVLLDLGLPDSRGVSTFTTVRSKAPDIPVIIHGRVDDESTAIRMLRDGAQDVVDTDSLNSHLLTRSIRYAIERQQLLIKTRNLSLMDELTGLYNRRGFVMLAEEQLKISRRSKVGMHFLFIDMDALKDINDRWGHHEGDNALRDIASILIKTFRQSDIVARLGGDEFCVLARETNPQSTRALKARLTEGIENHNQEAKRPYRLSVSTGMKRYSPGERYTPEDLIAHADSLMYKEKRRKNNKDDVTGRSDP